MDNGQRDSSHADFTGEQAYLIHSSKQIKLIWIYSISNKMLKSTVTDIINSGLDVLAFLYILISLSSIIDTAQCGLTLFCFAFGWMFPLTRMATAPLNRIPLRHGINAEAVVRKLAPSVLFTCDMQFGKC